MSGVDVVTYRVGPLRITYGRDRQKEHTMSGHNVRRQRSDDGPAGIEPAQLTPGLRVTIIIPDDEQHPGDVHRILEKVKATINGYIAAKKR